MAASDNLKNKKTEQTPTLKRSCRNNAVET